MGNKPSAEQAEELLAAVDASCVEAAQIIAGADIFLLCTGAGFSADSGLAVYADVAKVPAYSKRGLTYRDICAPCWLRDDPGLFWGFWGQCYNDYRQTAPHEGYAIIDRWAGRFRSSSKANEMKVLMNAGNHQDVIAGSDDPYSVSDQPGAFFAFTSNVDAHHFDWFRACEIRECHGNTELYQCAKRSQQSCAHAVWRAPLDFNFDVDTETMLAPAESTRVATATSVSQQGPEATSLSKQVHDVVLVIQTAGQTAENMAVKQVTLQVRPPMPCLILEESQLRLLHRPQLLGNRCLPPQLLAMCAAVDGQSC